MEEELREVLESMKSANERGMSRLEGKMEAMGGGLQAHMLESATRHVDVSASVKASHRRMDEHVDDHKTSSGKRWELTVALIVAGLSGLGTLVMVLYQLVKKT